MKGVVVYKGRYGATAQYARWLSRLVNNPACKSENVNSEMLRYYDLVVLGSSVYVGKLELAGWIKKHKHDLLNKHVILFIVCATPPDQTEELNKIIQSNIDGELRQNIKVFFLKGRMIKKKLGLIDHIVLRLGAALQKNKADRKRMLTDFDDVREENLKNIKEAVESYTQIENKVLSN